METIWKFRLAVTDAQNITMPEGATILCVQTQNDEPNLWAKVDPNAAKTKRYFEVFGTGHPIPEGNRTYIGTFQQFRGGLVFHVFELHKL